MTTLRDMKEEGWRVWLHCRGQEVACSHSWQASWDQLIQYFGPDFDISGDRAAFARLVCERCGGRGASVIVLPDPELTIGIDTGTSGHALETPVSLAEATRRYHAFMAERRALGIKTIAEANAESRAVLKAKRAAAKAGAGFIGPPDPRAHRRRVRPARE